MNNLNSFLKNEISKYKEMSFKEKNNRLAMCYLAKVVALESVLIEIGKGVSNLKYSDNDFNEITRSEYDSLILDKCCRADKEGNYIVWYDKNDNVVCRKEISNVGI